LFCYYTSALFFADKYIPIPDGDDLYYTLISSIYGINNQFSHPTQFVSPYHEGSLEYNKHDWFNPYIAGELVKNKGFSDYLKFNIFLNIIATILTLFILSRITNWYLGIIFLYPILVSVNSYLSGRYELMASIPIILGSGLLIFYKLDKSKCVLLSFLLGLIAVIHPTCGLLTGIFLTTYISWVENFKKWFIYNLILVFGSIFTIFLLTTLLSPINFGYWLKGLIEIGNIISSKTDSSNFIYYYFLQPSIPFAGLYFISLLFIIYSYSTYLSIKRNNIIPFILSGICIYFTYYFGIRIPTTCYNILIFIPIICLIIFILISKNNFSEVNKKVLKSFLIFMSLISLLSLSRNFIVNYKSYKDGISYNYLLKYINNHEDKNNILYLENGFTPIIFDKNLDPKIINNLKFFINYEDLNVKPEYIIFMQANSGKLYPENINGYKIIDNKFYNKDFKLFGIKYMNTLKAYNFALYKKND